MPLARISLTLSRHFSLSFNASGRSSGLYLVSSHSCWMYVRAGRPAFARPYVRVHRSTSLTSSSYTHTTLFPNFSFFLSFFLILPIYVFFQKKVCLYNFLCWIVWGRVNLMGYRYLPYPHQTSERGIKPRFRWVQALGCIPDTPGEHKNA